jgi:proline iminopeptidase
MITLFPEISPFHSFFLETGAVHRVYVEQSGNPAGIPVIFLHGGPCSGTKPDHRRFFDPERYHIVLFDQRGCGKSLPFGELEANTSQHLLADMEAIRKQLRVEQWLLFGGSWGATLGLLYAQTFPQQVSGMILRGVFLARQTDMDWFIGNGAPRIYPRQWQELLAGVNAKSGDNILTALCAAVFGEDNETAQTAARLWQSWGGLVALGNGYQQDLKPFDIQDLLQARMELHYARNAYFIAENRILDNCALLRSIPTIIIHGQQDLTCPPESGWSLYQALPHARFTLLPNAGHVAYGEEMITALVAAANDMANRSLSA